MSNSAHLVELRTNDGGPSLSDPNPQGELSQEPTELNVTVSDPDMPDDNVSVEFKLDGSVVGTDHLGDDGTASVSINPVQLDDDDPAPYSVVNFPTLSAASDTATKSTLIFNDASKSG